MEAAPQGPADTASLSAWPRQVSYFIAAVGILTAVCVALELFCGRFLHLGYPYNWPLMFPEVNFMDFRTFLDHFRTLHTQAFFEGPDILMYPAPIVVCYWFFYSFQSHATAVFLSVIVGSSLLAAALATRALIRRGLRPSQAVGLIVFTCVFSYPWWFEFKQANIEIVVWIILSLALLSFAKRHHFAAAILIGIAGALKFFPMVYLGLLISRKRYKECVIACAAAALTFIFSLWALGPTIPVAWHGTQFALAQFRRMYMEILKPNEFGFDHSLYAFVKFSLELLARWRIVPRVPDQLRAVWLSAYLAVAALTGTVLYFKRIRHLPMVNQVLCLVVASILLPPASFDYTLMHLYSAWLLLLFAALYQRRSAGVSQGMGAAFLLLGVAVSPFSELILGAQRFGGEARSLVLLALLVVGLRFPFPLPELDGPCSNRELEPQSALPATH